MIVFWLAVAVMVAIALALIVPALSGRTRVGGVARKQLNVTLHKQRLVELEAELRDGVLSQDQFELARAELQRDLLRDVGGDDEVLTTAPPRRLLWVGVIAAALPALAVGLYLLLGEMTYVGTPPAQLSRQQSPEMHSLEEMVNKLSARLQREPGDVDGWVLLGRSYVALQRYGEAALAFARAHELKGDDPQLLADYAEALAVANGNRLDGKPTQLAARALELQPENPKALWIAGVAAMQRGERDVAFTYLQRLQKYLPPNSDAAKVVQNFLAQATQSPQASGPASPPVTGAPSSPPPTAVGRTSTSLEVKVALDPALAARAAPQDVVFIFAQAPQGPRMPLAIVRSQVQALPATVTLDDSMAMMPAMKLSQFKEVVVGARISKSGDAMPRSGDLEGRTGVIKLDAAKTINVTIDRVLP